MAITNVQDVASGLLTNATSPQTLTVSSTTAGDLGLVLISLQGGTTAYTFTVSDNAAGGSSTWANAAYIAATGTTKATVIAYCLNLKAGVTQITVTASGGSGNLYGKFSFVQFHDSTAGTWSLGQTNTGIFTASTSGSSVSTPTLTQAGANANADAVVAAVLSVESATASSAISSPGTGGATWTSSWVQQDDATNNAGQASWRIDTSVVTDSIGWTYSVATVAKSANGSVDSIATFLLTAGGGGSSAQLPEDGAADAARADYELDDLAPFVVDSAPVGPDAPAAPAALAQSDDIWWLFLPPADEIDVLIDDAANSDSDPFYSDEPWATVYAGLAEETPDWMSTDAVGPDGVAAFAFTGSGGIQFGGAGATTFSANFAAAGAGGLQFGGGATSSFSANYTASGSGGLQFAGVATAAFTSAFAATGSGGLQFGGAAAASFDTGFSATGSGGIQFGGSASAVEVNFYVFSASGGLLFDGSAVALLALPGSGNDPDPNSVGPRVALRASGEVMTLLFDADGTPYAARRRNGSVLQLVALLGPNWNSAVTELGDIVNII